MDEYEPERPPDEAWWERELHRNEKLMDKYMAVLGDNPDWDKWKNPEDLYNKVHFGIDPPERGESDNDLDDEPRVKADLTPGTLVPEQNENESDESSDDEWLAEADELDEEDPDEDPAVNQDYSTVAGLARKFAVAVFQLGDDVPANAELLFLSAGKVGANLAGGHGLGYDDDSICGNIVKCRWALGDCEFCREMLEQLHQQSGDERYGKLAEESRALAEMIRDRIARLRKRVWW